LIRGIKNDQGQIIVGLHKDESGFPGTPYVNVTGEIKNGKCLVKFKNLPTGEYAIALFHDENSNEILDHGFLGIRHLEGFGVSNNIMPLFTPPRYSDARFFYGNDSMSTTINIEY
jgi:uncharacterized protein (DUF2141 family)